MKTKYMLKRAVLFPLIFALILLTGSTENNSAKVLKRGNVYYLSNTLIIKTKTSQTAAMQKAGSLLPELNKVFAQYKFTSVRQIFSDRQPADKFGLNRIMEVNYSTDEDPFIVAAKLKNLDNIEWAEPRFLRHAYEIKYTPNDQLLSSQYYLAIDHIFDAWNVTKGDTSVVIGIVDTGVDWPHPDLYANIWHNWKDINSNWASDTDGIKYDSIGWDFGGLGNADGSPTPDSNPIEDVPEHGTLIAGVASAVTDNGIGIAGIGFKSKIMAVKVAQKNITDQTPGPTYGEQLIAYGFEGIKYAADNGAKVINCSWGGSGYSQAEQDVINYAVSKGSLVVVAAGNDNTDAYEYPAAYANVLSVGATDNQDVRASYSDYGNYVDLCAPGNGIYSTWQPNSYLSASGTSLSTPQVSGLAALVFAQFPNYTPLQVAQQIRVNCDNIDSGNPGYKYQLGSGRINAYKALTNTNSEAVRAVNISATDSIQGGNGNGAFEPGETIGIRVNFTNFLKPTQNLNVSLVSMNPYSTVTGGNFDAGSQATLASFSNNSSIYKITLSQNLPNDITLTFKLNFSDGSYSDFQMFNINANPSYLLQANGTVAATITSKGNIGFNDYPVNSQGSGFEYMSGNNLLFEGALILGTSADTIEDEARGADQNYKDTAFSIVTPFSIVKNNSDMQEGLTVFNDDNIGTGKLGIVTKLQTYTYTQSPDNNFIILKYNFTNSSAAAVSNFYAGIFMDWDLIDGQNDNAAYDAQNNYGYVYHNGFNTMVASALISSDKYGYWAITNDGSSGAFSIYDGFSYAEKWQAISSGIGSTTAGPGDVSEVTSSGPYSIQPGQTVTVAFVIAAGSSTNQLTNAVSEARNKYQEILTAASDETPVPVTFQLSQNYPNPFNPTTKIKYAIPTLPAGQAGSPFNPSPYQGEGNRERLVTLKVYDILGREVATLVNEEKPAGTYEVTWNASNQPSGVYFYQLKAGNFTATKKLILLK